jgi:hypothetical protein
LWIDEHMDGYLKPVPESLNATIEVIMKVYNDCLDNVKEEQNVAVKEGMVAPERPEEKTLTIEVVEGEDT